MTNFQTLVIPQQKICSIIWQVIFVILISLFGYLAIYSQQNNNSQTSENTIVIEEVKDGEVFAFGKTVIVKKGVKGVLVFGGDLIVEGKIDEDAAVIGGSIIQKNDGFIGGDVIVFGGKYQHDREQPLRNIGKETIMYAGYEEELRNFTQDPTQIFSPQLTWSYFAQRVFSVLFWFLITLLLTTIAPGAISRAVTNFKLSSLKIVGFGLLGFIAITIFVIISFSYLPANFSGIIGILSTLFLLLAYFYGRITLNVWFGKLLQKYLIPEKHNSETLGIFLGTLGWVLILSVPYFGNIAVVLLFAASLGLIFTTRSNNLWKTV